jgi:selenocysteine lyase/cysteine desulfurase
MSPSKLALDEAAETFLEQYPTFRATAMIDDLRAREFPRLDAQGHVYVDYTGGGLYAESLVRKHADLLVRNVFGNPHSNNPSSRLSTDLIASCRRHVLRFFNARPDDYGIVFTANASHALKLVGEAYPFEPGDQFLLTFDNHNSVNGIREFDRARGAQTVYVPVTPPDLRIEERTLDRLLDRAEPGRHNLFAYPAQSNFSGVQHPLEWIARAQNRGWDVLLDAAAFVPANRLDLSRCQPDYVALSFYKMFGYPTGVGALVARWPALKKLHRPWFSGGTITVASVQGDRHYLASGAEAFEDGTLDYVNIPAVADGLELLEWAGLDVIHERVRCLTNWLIGRLLELRHSNGRPLVRLYGPTTDVARGGTVAFNLHRPDSEMIPHQTVEARAFDHTISLRTGCFCNPGAGEVALGLAETDLTRCLSGARDRMSREDFWRCIDTRNTGAVRISLGLASNFADVYKVLRFVEEFVA